MWINLKWLLLSILFFFWSFLKWVFIMHGVTGRFCTTKYTLADWQEKLPEFSLWRTDKTEKPKNKNNSLISQPSAHYPKAIFSFLLCNYSIKREFLFIYWNRTSRLLPLRQESFVADVTSRSNKNLQRRKGKISNKLHRGSFNESATDSWADRNPYCTKMLRNNIVKKEQEAILCWADNIINGQAGSHIRKFDWLSALNVRKNYYCY